MKYIFILAAIIMIIALSGFGCVEITIANLLKGDRVWSESDVYTPSLYSAYLPGASEEKIKSDLRTHLEKVVEYDPELRIYAVVFLSQEISFTQFQSVFYNYRFDASNIGDVLYIDWGDRCHHAEFTPELTSSDTVIQELTSQVPWNPPTGIDELKIEGFIALVEAQDALRLWDDETVPVRGIGITGTESHGIRTMWTVPRPSDPLR